jgi:hypothetical protein
MFSSHPPSTHNNRTQLINDKLNSVLNEYQATYQSDPLKLRLAIPAEEIWRFFVDGNRQKWGWIEFEKRERGYLRAMIKAFQTIFTTPPDLGRFIKELHFMATDQVHSTLYSADNWWGGNKRKYRIINFVYSVMSTETVTKNGIVELLETIRQQKEASDFLILGLGSNAINKHISIVPDSVNSLCGSEVTSSTKSIFNFKDRTDNNGFCVHLNPLHNRDVIKKIFTNNTSISSTYYVNEDKGGELDVRAVMEKRMRELLESYHHSTASTPFEKLLEIIKFIRNCERLHPFTDGNTRTFSMLLLNHLLIKNGFPCVIRDEPNKIYAVTIEELCLDVLRGMQRTLDLAAGLSPYRIRTKRLLAELGEDKAVEFTRAVVIEQVGREKISSPQSSEADIPQIKKRRM